MHMTDYQKLAEAKTMAIQMDKLARTARKFSPTAPVIIPLLLIFVTLFAVICILIKLLKKLKGKNQEKENKFRPSNASSPDIPTTPEHDQSSMATTASMKTRGSLRLNPDRRKQQKLPPVSLYQMKAKQSPGSSSKTNRAAMKALARSARAEANRSISRDSTRQMEDNSDDNGNNNGDASPGNMSQRSDDTDDLGTTINQTGGVYAATAPNAPPQLDQVDGEINHERSLPLSSEQPELHIVQMREVEDVHHSQPTWPQNGESDI